MLYEWQRFLTTPAVWVSGLIALALNLATWGILLLNISPKSGVIVLHYTLYFGVDRLGNWYEIFLVPALGTIFLAVNLIVAAIVESRSRVLSRLLLFLTPVIESLLLLAAIFLVIANLPQI